MRKQASKTLKISSVLISFFLFMSALQALTTSSYSSDNLPARDSHDSVSRVTSKELKTLLDRGEIVLIVDVRPSAAYKARHISGAISVPLEEVESRLGGVPRLTNIVFY